MVEIRKLIKTNGEEVFQYRSTVPQWQGREPIEEDWRTVPTVYENEIHKTA